MIFIDIKLLKGVGEARAKAFGNLSIYTLEDMICHFPKSYEDRTQIKEISDVLDDEIVCLKVIPGDKTETVYAKTQTQLTVYKRLAYDESGRIEAVWFNQKYTANSLESGREYILYGKVSKKGRVPQIINPIAEKITNTKYTLRIMPIYGLTANLTQKVMQAIIENALQVALDKNLLEEFLPEQIRTQYKLISRSCAIKSIHFPKDYTDLNCARRRLAFEELFLLQIGLLTLKTHTGKQQGFKWNVVDTEHFIKSLPFELTGAQRRVIEEIKADVQKSVPMNRLVQGDVGSGKTAIAAAAIHLAVKNGMQAAFMAPTSILACQHLNTLNKLFPDLRVELLISALQNKQKEKIKQDIKAGLVDVVVGTHALIRQEVEFLNLGLAITDEQHRFGVEQRKMLSAKGNNPHTLVMTATPIPRTLGLILYGDLDISTVDELPPSRQKVDTFVVDEKMRNRINNFLLKHLALGEQVYIVCPMVDDDDTAAAIQVAQCLKSTVFSRYNVDVIHGRMKQEQKDAVMQAFVDKDIDILVATTVIEVGVNVPNATIMVIEGAENFGLSQLHQLRGRVGRGNIKSYCILFNNSNSDDATERMKIMEQTNDGFKIAQKDLEIRGPGEFFGTRQHGIPSLKVADLGADMDILKEAQQAAHIFMDMVQSDSPELDNYLEIKDKIIRMFERIEL